MGSKKVHILKSPELSGLFCVVWFGKFILEDLSLRKELPF
ncbi:hypothetical protein HMP0721_1143 [Pseudoramibacter alactolyticus ATCC 23263]|uniref:Uncharacterized protein n=1 Tax=Pseudoramibacter alactolyticus ATCC 23263 TaxID=887929 RepID=E6MGL0_9FIRM|nr:hypothetical protein HMP0721_1143 [Pseudoramibacter alactolyticus ATCC 23263]